MTNADTNLPLIAARSVHVTLRRGQPASVSVDAPQTVSAPVRRGQRIGTATVSVGDVAVGHTPLIAGRSLEPTSAGSLPSRIDDAIPGSRAVAWVAAVAALAAIVIGIAVGLIRGRRD